jgi:predicted phosphatase
VVCKSNVKHFPLVAIVSFKTNFIFYQVTSLQDGNNKKLFLYQKVTILATMLKIIGHLVYFLCWQTVMVSLNMK